MRFRRAHRCAFLLIPMLAFHACRVEHGAGTAIEPAPLPQRIIALTPSLVETLFALGLGDRVAGVGSYVFWPPAAAARPRIGGLFDPNLERIVSLKPDLAVLLPSERDLATRLKPLGVDVLVVPDETLLFQYSALGFNSHRIHIDREHARKVEGFPDLVVNGGLATLLLTEFLRRDLGVTPAAIAVRHVAPLYCNRAVTLAADQVGKRWILKAFDDQHRLAVDMEVDV